jgi:F-type H+-transporting ATPase subunit delta
LINQVAAQRYARALFEIAKKTDQVETVLNEIRELNQAIQKDPSNRDFFSMPVTKCEDQKKVLDKVLSEKKFSEATKNLTLLLSEKRRMKLLPQIASCFQAAVDASQNIDRGIVRSAATLFPDDRQNLEKIISRYTGRKAVLEYQDDKQLLGGLVAKVGSFTFDDSLETQLRLMKEELRKRRSN